MLILCHQKREEIAGPKEATELAMGVNNVMAELVVEYLSRLGTATAVLPMSDIERRRK